MENKNHYEEILEESLYLYFLNLLFQSTDVGITLRGRLVELHNAHKRVRIVLEDPNYRLVLVMKQNLAARFQKIFVDVAHDGDIELWPRSRAYNSMVVVNDFLHGTHGHGAPTQVINFRTILLILLLTRARLRLKSLLVLDELLLK